MYAKKRGPRCGRQTTTIDLSLRTPHVHYLEYLAEQHGLSVSGAFGLILEKHTSLTLLSYKPPRKEKKHLLIDPRHAEILERLAVRSGLFKADIARRLIDEAMARDEVVGG